MRSNQHVIDGPGGSLIEELTAPLDRNKATYTMFAGKKRIAASWPPGRYEGRVEIVREGGVIATSIAELDLPR